MKRCRMSRSNVLRLSLLAGLVWALFPIGAQGLEPGDLVFADSSGVWTGLGYNDVKKGFGVGVGHTGIYVGEKNGIQTVVHCAWWCGVAEIALEDFPGGGNYQGARTSYPAPTPEERREIIEFAYQNIGKPFTRIPWRKKGPYEFTCAGFVEAAYEYAGLDPTPRWCGDLPYRYIWPIEQFYSPKTQCADSMLGPLVSGPKQMLGRLWLTWGMSFTWWSYAAIVLVVYRNQKRAVRLKKSAGCVSEQRGRERGEQARAALQLLRRRSG